MKRKLLSAALFLSFALAAAPLFAQAEGASTLKGLLDGLKDPNIVYLLLIIGFYGIIFEIATPGVSVGGVIGVTGLALAFMGMGGLPVNYTGLILMLLSFVLFVLDVKAPTHGILTVAGILALTFGSLILFKTDPQFAKLSKALIAAMVISTTGLMAFVLPLILKAQKRKASSGTESLADNIGEAKTDLVPKGIVHIKGEDWYAESLEGTIKSGEKVKVKFVEGLIVKVEKAR
ncbi:MAG: NfeD family protein [Candidatus Omnitrophica bacterium]|nr:NfeD family protein [Candidatus Omnitrophota bacterium]MDD5546585.1 NfeD family protein [Candidatus Omnitrophota bacterium]